MKKNKRKRTAKEIEKIKEWIAIRGLKKMDREYHETVGPRT
jgi:hypothetical protein